MVGQKLKSVISHFAFPVFLLVVIIVVLAGIKPADSNVTGSVVGSLCQSDCTYAYDNVCHAGCEGLNGCAFFDSDVKEVCSNRGKDFRLDFNATHKVQCCVGGPYVPVLEAASTEVDAEHWVRIVRNFWYEGELIKFVLDIFS